MAEVNGGYFGGYVKPANKYEHRADRRLGFNSGKREIVVIIRERSDYSVPAVLRTKGGRCHGTGRALPHMPRYAQSAA